MPTESQNNNTEFKQESEELSMKDLILKAKEWKHYLLSKWATIFVFITLGCVLGFVYAYFKKTTYIATTTFVLEEGNSGGGALGNIGGIASMVGIDLGGGGGGIFQGDNILELYKSRTMIEKTLLTEVDHNGKKQLLIDQYINFNGLNEKWSKKGLKDVVFDNVNSNRKNPTLSRLQDSLLGEIVNDIRLNYLSVGKPDKKLSIIRADTRAQDEFFAKNFNDQIVQNVNDFYIQTKTKKSLENVSILQQKTDSVRRVMNGAIYKAAVVVDATPNLNPTRQTQRVAPVQQSQFSAETNKTVLGELVKNLELSKMSLRKETPLIQVIDQPILPLEVFKVSKIKTVIVGGIASGFIILVVLIIKKLLKDILK